MFIICMLLSIGACVSMPSPLSSLTIAGDLTDDLGSLTAGLKSSSNDSPIENLIAGLTDGSTSSGLDAEIPALLENINDLASGAVTGLGDGTSVIDILKSATNGLPNGLDITLNGVADSLKSNDPVNDILNEVAREVSMNVLYMDEKSSQRTICGV